MTTTPHKILSVFVQTKLDGVDCVWDDPPIELVRRAERAGEMHKFKKDIYFCAYKTVFEEDPAVIMLFTMLLPGTTTGASEVVMSIVAILETVLAPYDDIYLIREDFNVKKNVAIIRIVKKIRETDIV